MAAISIDLSGQSTNPFDIDGRIIPEVKGEVPAPVFETNNPFDIKNTERISRKNLLRKPLPESSITLPQRGKASSTFIFWLLIAILLLLASLISSSYRDIRKIYKSFTNGNILTITLRDKSQVFSLSYMMLYVLFVLNFGLFIFLFLKQFGLSYIIFNAYAYFFIVLITMFLIFFKHSILKLIEFVFPIKKEIRQYSFTIFIFNVILGLSLIPINLIAAYSPTGISKTAIIIGVIIVSIIYLFRVFRSIFLGNKYLIRNFFHFFIYLCAVEIAPVLIFMKLFIYNTGLL